MKPWTRLLLLLGVVTPLGWSTQAGALLIDSFDTGQILIAPPGRTLTSEKTTGGGDILGGERDASVTSGPGLSATSLQTNLFGSSLAAYSQGSSDPDGTASIVWDGVDGSPAIDPAGLGGVDLTRGSHDAFELGIVFQDLPALLTFTVTTSAGSVSQVVVALPSPISSATSVFVPYASFVPVLGEGADFTDVGAITLTIAGDPGADVVMDFFQTGAQVSVAEPGTALLLLAGAIGLMLASRRSG